mgnify:CR=1 FL=1
MTDHVATGGLAAAEIQGQEASANRAAAERGDAPLLPSERLWGFWEFTYANSALAIATWAFLIGGAIGLFVAPREGIAAMAIGNIIGVTITALATCVATGRYGLEQFDRGVETIPLFYRYFAAEK